MTWSTVLEVQDVSDGPAPIDILAASDEVSSNTEGKISGIEIRFKLDADETSIKVGDRVTASGSFYTPR